MNGQIGTALLLWLQVERRSVGAGQVGLDVVWTGPRWRDGSVVVSTERHRGGV
jgi:hypothetical protein